MSKVNLLIVTRSDGLYGIAQTSSSIKVGDIVECEDGRATYHCMVAAVLSTEFESDVHCWVNKLPSATSRKITKIWHLDRDVNTVP